jgi:hypothetical protein
MCDCGIPEGNKKILCISDCGIPEGNKKILCLINT